MSKVVFIDVDGTLVTYENDLPASAVEAIYLARAKGHKVFICTGRSKAEIYDDIWKIGFDGMICGNGSYIEADGKVVMHHTLSLEECISIVDYLDSNNLDYYIESNSGLYASENFEIGAKEALQEYAARKGKPDAEKMTVSQAFPKMIFGGNRYRDDVNKISYVLKSYEDYKKTAERFNELKNGVWGGAGEKALFGDIGVKDIDKSVGVDVLLSYLGADRCDTIAIGDSKVDIPMLEYCSTGVAMGNGGQEIKTMADIVTDDVDKDGLYIAFQRLELI